MIWRSPTWRLLYEPIQVHVPTCNAYSTWTKHLTPLAHQGHELVEKRKDMHIIPKLVSLPMDASKLYHQTERIQSYEHAIILDQRLLRTRIIPSTLAKRQWQPCQLLCIIEKCDQDIYWNSMNLHRTNRTFVARKMCWCVTLGCPKETSHPGPQRTSCLLPIINIQTKKQMDTNGGTKTCS